MSSRIYTSFNFRFPALPLQSLFNRPSDSEIESDEGGVRLRWGGPGRVESFLPVPERDFNLNVGVEMAV